ncbi:hypothetical protein ACHAXS_011516, partial [Conticribra weissflogii]
MHTIVHIHEHKLASYNISPITLKTFLPNMPTTTT